jgi:hypothetical protein
MNKTFKFILLASFPLCLFILSNQTSQASHMACDPSTNPFEHGATHMANGGGSHKHYNGPEEDSFEAPSSVKGCVQSIFNNGDDIVGMSWTSPFSGTGVVSLTLFGSIATASIFNGAPPDYITDAEIKYEDSYLIDSDDIEISGSRGIIDFNGLREFDMGQIDKNQSKGRRHTILIDTDDIPPEAAFVCFETRLSFRFNLRPISDTGTLCTELRYTPPVASTQYRNTPDVTTAVTVAEPGDTVDFGIYITNSGDGGNPYAIDLTALNPSSAIFTPICTPPAFISSASCSWNNATAPPAPGPGATIGPYNYQFTISATAPSGTYCFDARVEPGAGESSPTPSITQHSRTDPSPPCITISRSRHPYVDTQGSNVHAGARYGEPCLLSPSIPRTVSGVTNGMIGSKGQYIVSASGEVINSGIRRFGSSNSASSNDLTFGNNGPLGSYGEICRPDLAGKLLSDPSVNPVDPGLFGILSGLGLPLINLITPLPNNLISKHTGNVALIGSPLGLPLFGGETLANGQRKTLVVDGDVFIVGDIKRSTSGYTSIKSVPSFAVIATGNIYISPEVRELYGIFYAGGEINTCSLLGINPPITIPLGAVPCSLPLQINGSLFARRILFRRTRGGVESFASNVHAERVTFQPGLMLNSPPGFGDFLTNVIFKGDLPPAY